MKNFAQYLSIQFEAESDSEPQTDEDDVEGDAAAPDVPQSEPFEEVEADAPNAAQALRSPARCQAKVQKCGCEII